MKKILILLSVVISALAITAKTRVVDPEGQPMIGTAILDRDGSPIGIVDDEGLLPEIPAHRYPIVLTCMGFERIAVPAPVDSIVMKPPVRELSEVVVSPGDRPAMYVTCYIREISSITNGTDSINYSADYMGDYMLPAFKGAKCPTWDEPRVLNGKVEWHSTSPNITYDDYVLKDLSLAIASLSKKPLALPDSLKSVSQGVVTTRGKRGSENVFRLSPTSLSVVSDKLAGMENHTFKLPGIFKLLGFSMEITKCWEQMLFNYDESGHYDVSDLQAQAFAFQMYCTGKAWKRIFTGGDAPVIVNTYVEVYPVEINYLTKEEAKEIKKEKPQRQIEVPQAAIN